MTGQAHPSTPEPSTGEDGVDARAARQLLAALGDPPIALVLWNGQEVAGAYPPLARLRLTDCAALYRLLLDPALQISAPDCRGRIGAEGELLILLAAVFTAMRDALQPGRLRRLADWRIHHGRPGAAEQPPHPP